MLMGDVRMINSRSRIQKMFVLVARSLVTVLLISAGTSANAVDIGTFSGHEVHLTKENYETVLTIDGRALHRNSIISFDDVASIAGVLTVIGSSSPGGNACDSSPFVLSFPAGAAPRLDGPVDTCASITHRLEGDRIMFSTSPVPGRKTEQWEWTSANGLKTLAATDFQPESGSGWGSIRERKFEHPADAFRNQEISSSIHSLVGSNFEYFQELMTGVGSGDFKGDDYVGAACRPHNCDQEAGLLFLSAQDRQIFAAWKPEGGKIVVHPNVKAWPEKAKAELRVWAKQWK